MLDEVLRSNFDLKSANAGTDVNMLEFLATFVDVCGEVFLHADGRTPATDVAGERKEFFHGDEVALLVARYLSGLFQVHFVLAGDDTDEMPRLVAM